MLENDTSLQSSPQLVLVEQPGVVVALSTKQVMSLFKKSEQSGIPFDTLKEVYQRGYTESLSEQTAYNRVNSFIAGGAAMELDQDLLEKRGLWDNIHAKRERIKHGSGEHMRKPGSKGAPTKGALKKSQSEEVDLGIKSVEERRKEKQRDIASMVKFASAARRKLREEYTDTETVSKNPNDPTNRFVGTTALDNNYRNSTPGQTISTIKKVVKEHCGCKKEMEEDAKGYKSPSGGLTQKGRDHYNRESGGHLKAPVTKEPSKLKAGSKAAGRRKSFCARMGGVEGPMKKPNGEPTRKALALRKWNC